MKMSPDLATFKAGTASITSHTNHPLVALVLGQQFGMTAIQQGEALSGPVGGKQRDKDISLS